MKGAGGGMRFGRPTAVMVLAVGLSACASTAPIPTYDLTAPQQFPPLRGAMRGQLVVQEPTALAILDTDRIVVRPGEDQVAQLSDAQWVDRLPKLLQSRIVQAFENANRLRGVARPGDRIAPDYQLVVDVRQFALTVGTEAQGEVELSAKIVAERTGRIVAARIFRATVPAASSVGGDAVRAIDEAFGRVVVELVTWASRWV